MHRWSGLWSTEGTSPSLNLTTEAKNSRGKMVMHIDSVYCWTNKWTKLPIIKENKGRPMGFLMLRNRRATSNWHRLIRWWILLSQLPVCSLFFRYYLSYFGYRKSYILSICWILRSKPNYEIIYFCAWNLEFSYETFEFFDEYRRT